MNTKKKIFIISMPIIMAICSLFFICDYVDAAPRAPVRSAPVVRKTVSKSTTQKTQETIVETQEESPESVQPDQDIVNEEPFIINKSNQFETTVSEIVENATDDNSFAEMIRKQRAALELSESTTATKNAQQNALKSGKNTCDSGLRECMIKTCGNDFTKCATDSDTIFGDKLNKCRRDVECNGEEFKLFTNEIKADRDMNVKLLSYTNVINCGNAYNACMQNECGTTFSKCLSKAHENTAIQKCTDIAKECTEYDSGLTSRFNTAIGTLRENAEKDIAKDEKRLYELRDLMSAQCKTLGATFDERTFNCVFTVNFFAGENQTTPVASRKRYAGESFVCMQEWFGINATTYKENAYRETRAQTAASSGMLGAGVGTAAGLVTSNAVGRAIKTQQAKKAMDAAAQSNNNLSSSDTPSENQEETTTDNDTNFYEAQANIEKNRATGEQQQTEIYNKATKDAVEQTLTGKRNELGEKISFQENLKENLENADQQKQQDLQKQIKTTKKLLDKNTPNRFLPDYE